MFTRKAAEWPITLSGAATLQKNLRYIENVYRVYSGNGNESRQLNPARFGIFARVDAAQHQDPYAVNVLAAFLDPEILSWQSAHTFAALG